MPRFYFMKKFNNCVCYRENGTLSSEIRSFFGQGNLFHDFRTTTAVAEDKLMFLIIDIFNNLDAFKFWDRSYKTLTVFV